MVLNSAHQDASNGHSDSRGDLVFTEGGLTPEVCAIWNLADREAARQGFRIDRETGHGVHPEYGRTSGVIILSRTHVDPEDQSWVWRYADQNGVVIDSTQSAAGAAEWLAAEFCNRQMFWPVDDRPAE